MGGNSTSRSEEVDRGRQMWVPKLAVRKTAEPQWLPEHPCACAEDLISHWLVANGWVAMQFPFLHIEALEAAPPPPRPMGFVALCQSLADCRIHGLHIR
jgi:hypothetical protein